jgi:hypothetical protein
MTQLSHTTLRVSQPCHESWATMTLTTLGRHCATCQKTVVDFTHKTDAEILAYLAQAGRGNTCGRFRKEQLGRPLRPALPVPPATRWQAWLAGLLLATLALQSCQHTLGEPQPTVTAPSKPLITLGDSCLTTLSTDSVAVAGADSSAEMVYEVELGDVEALHTRH